MTTDSNKVYQTLKHRLLTGQYKPGTQLKENQLANEFFVSRTPIRTALGRLVQDGLLNKTKDVGVSVSAWSKWDVEEVFQIRKRLEPFATQLAATRRTQEELDLITLSNQRFKAALEGPSELVAKKTEEANRLFHTTILQASRSDRLISILETMIDMPILVRSFHLYDLTEMTQSYHHHIDIALAIENQQPELAQQVMELHLAISYQRFLKARAPHLY